MSTPLLPGSSSRDFPATARWFEGAFTRLELIVVLAALVLVVVVEAPIVAGSSASANRAVCGNNLRRLGLAALQYAAENEGCFPSRIGRPGWPQRLRPYFSDVSLLRCPEDPYALANTYPLYPVDTAPRSYIYNAFNDYFATVLTPAELNNYLSGRCSNGIPARVLAEPSATILLGEKPSVCRNFYMDLFLSGLTDIGEVDRGRHFKSPAQADSGGSNHAFVDGSVRFLGFWGSLLPTNQWAAATQYRTNYNFH